MIFGPELTAAVKALEMIASELRLLRIELEIRNETDAPTVYTVEAQQVRQRRAELRSER